MPKSAHRSRLVVGSGVAVAAAAAVVASGVATSSAHAQVHPANQAGGVVLAAATPSTTTPIKHVVVLFDENVSYDHYFGTYPDAANIDGVKFTALKGTPANNNLISSGMISAKNNPNEYRPRRLSPSEALTCDQNHNYGPEQQAMDAGKMDQYVQKVSTDTCTGEFGEPGLTMDYYDGNTVTGLWNYAQQFAMSDHSFDQTFGPSTPGALNLVAGQTHGFKEVDSVTGEQVPTPGTYVLASPDSSGVGTVINDPDPAFDDCSDSNHTSKNTLAEGTGKNIGDLLNAKGVTWGWFQGGFAPTTAYAGTGTYAVCGATHTNVGGATVVDYSPHHNPFQYYASTSNPHHVAPAGVSEIGKNGPANHQYDLSWFDKSIKAGDLPSVSFVKAGEYQDGHGGYSDPIDEQHFLVNTINEIQQSKYWSSTAIVIAYDDSDGWYDHLAPTITNGSADAKNDTAMCSGVTTIAGGYADRCGPGPRLPLLVISPYAKTDYVAHNVTTQASILQFIEKNWKTGEIGDGSFDATAGSLNPMFNFAKSNNKRVILNANGSIKSISKIVKKPGKKPGKKKH